MRQALVFLVFMGVLGAVLGCSETADPIMAVNDCSVSSMGQNRFGYLTCMDDQEQVVECPDICPGVNQACVTKCKNGELSNGPVWTCPCDGDPCWRTVQNRLQQCPGCGDELREGMEQCDTTDFGGADCVSLGCTGGTLNCSATCTFDKTFCTGCP